MTPTDDTSGAPIFDTDRRLLISERIHRLQVEIDEMASRHREEDASFAAQQAARKAEAQARWEALDAEYAALIAQVDARIQRAKRAEQSNEELIRWLLASPWVLAGCAVLRWLWGWVT